MSFYSYKNANADSSPGPMSGNALSGLTERICVQVKNVYDSCMQQEQLDDETITVSNIVPVLPDRCGCPPGFNNSGINCVCSGCSCNCKHTPGPTFEQVMENVDCNCPFPMPSGPLTFESCRSSSTCGSICNLSIDRLCDRPQFARIRGTVHIPIEVLFVDSNCQEWMGQGVVSVDKDVIMCIPEESIVPFTLDSLVSAICVSGTHKGGNTFEITICVTIVLKIIAEVEVMIPSFGFCQIPPCEEFAENVCDEFFSLPLFPQQFACSNTSSAGTGCTCNTSNTCSSRMFSCSKCGTSCSSCGSLCPRCGASMTACM